MNFEFWTRHSVAWSHPSLSDNQIQEFTRTFEDALKMIPVKSRNLKLAQI